MQLTTNNNVILDRRASGPHPAGLNSPGVTRIELVAAKEVRKHDAMYLDFDANEWQTTYSLLQHQAGVARVMEQVGRARQRPEDLIQLGRLAGLLHDMGKLHPGCQRYRKRAVLTDEEREWLTEKHPEYSVQFAERVMMLARSEDRPYIGRAFPLIRHHHKPWRIEEELLREIGYDLMMSDGLNAMLEKREDEESGMLEALERLEAWNPCERYPEHEPYMDLIGESKRAIIWLFGLHPNLSGEPNPFLEPDA